MSSVTTAAFRTTITVAAPIGRAFTVFTAGFDSWWPREHHIGSSDLAEVVIEGRVGGLDELLRELVVDVAAAQERKLG